mmetsp:Transcript_2795/g.6043  ORF Transcript_2795/g.6043 Transcript_2795/m.6043 type:complete len:330 (-) Transcript_2795:110-1099(-)
MTERLEHWDQSLTSKLTDVQSKISLASQLPAGSSSRSSLLSDAHKLLVRCRFAKTTYKSELSRLDEDSRTRRLYEKKMVALEDVMVRAEEDLEALESAAVVDMLPDDNTSIVAPSPGVGGCAALPNAAMETEERTYDRMHKLFDPLLDFTTTQCGCNPISFAVGTGGRYEHQNSVVDEYEDTNAFDLMSAATSYVPSLFREEPSVASPKTVASKMNGTSATRPNGDNTKAKDATKDDTKEARKDAISSNGDNTEKKKDVEAAAPSTSPSTVEKIASPIANNKSALEERGQRLEQLNDQTSELESGAQTFADMAKQLKNKAKEEATQAEI